MKCDWTPSRSHGHLIVLVLQRFLTACKTIGTADCKPCRGTRRAGRSKAKSFGDVPRHIFPSPMVSTPRLPYGSWIPPGEIENFRIHRYWTGASLQGRLMRGGEISFKRDKCHPHLKTLPSSSSPNPRI